MLKAYLSEKEVSTIASIFRTNNKTEKVLLCFHGQCEKCKVAVVHHLFRFREFPYVSASSLKTSSPRRTSELQALAVVSTRSEHDVFLVNHWAKKNAYKVYWFKFRNET